MVRQGSTGSRAASMAEIRVAWDALPFKPDDEAGIKPPKWPWENTSQGYGRPNGKPVSKKIGNTYQLMLHRQVRRLDGARRSRPLSLRQPLPARHADVGMDAGEGASAERWLLGF